MVERSMMMHTGANDKHVYKFMCQIYIYIYIYILMVDSRGSSNSRRGGD